MTVVVARYDDDDDHDFDRSLTARRDLPTTDRPSITRLPHHIAFTSSSGSAGVDHIAYLSP